ncbi:hypothetical protein JCM18918_3157 [Cutibacterium acnes JCM 18918]|nr:hypothetical protein JCM18918_3157 [Cutibacterium acnes JCM 18918]
MHDRHLSVAQVESQSRLYRCPGAKEFFSSGTRRVRCALVAWNGGVWLGHCGERSSLNGSGATTSKGCLPGLSSSGYPHRPGGLEGVALDCGGVAGWAEAWPGRKIRASMPSAVRGIGSSPCQERK